MVFGFKVSENKRVAKNKSLELKAKQLSERNKAVGSLEKAKSERARIRKSKIDRNLANFNSFSKKVKGSIKNNKGRRKISSSPFAPENWK